MSICLILLDVFFDVWGGLIGHVVFLRDRTPKVQHNDPKVQPKNGPRVPPKSGPRVPPKSGPRAPKSLPLNEEGDGEGERGRYDW